MLFDCWIRMCMCVYFHSCVGNGGKALHDLKQRRGLDECRWFTRTQIQNIWLPDYIYSQLSTMWLWEQQSSFGTAGADMTPQDVLDYLLHSYLECVCVCVRCLCTIAISCTNMISSAVNCICPSFSLCDFFHHAISYPLHFSISPKCGNVKLTSQGKWGM